MDEITIELKKSEFRSGETIEGYYSINEDFPGASRVTLTLRAKKDTMLNLEFDRAGENELEVNRQVVLHEGSVFAENCQSVPFSVKLPEGFHFIDLMHGHDERIPVEGFFFGVRVLFDLVARLCTGF